MKTLRSVALGLVLTIVAAAQQSISFLADDGGRICAQLYGEGPHAVVLAHGGRFTKESWRVQADLLASQGFWVLAIDFRGFGCSAGPGQADFDHAPFANDVLAVQWRKVSDMSDGVSSIVVHGDELYALTYKGAPRYKVVRMSARKPNFRSAEVVVPAGEAVIQELHGAQDALYVKLLDAGIGRVLRVPYDRNAAPERIALPFEGSVWMDTDLRIPGALLYVTSWTKAFRVYEYDPSTKQTTETKLQPVGPYDNPENIQSIEVKAKSYDGTLVPLSITYRRNIKRDGSNPTWLEGYGAFGDSYPPFFLPTVLAWFENGGGVHAVCHVRGGGEYGEEWHLAGKMKTKPNTWKDFIACAQYLIDDKYTSPAHLAGEGVSAGGVLIGRAITERPDLFAAAIDKVGMSDTLRSETTQNGETNIPEFGTTKTEEGFKVLYAMSPYDHVEEKTKYPAVLLETGFNDPRVSPWEMGKMTARLQAATSSGKPVLLRVDFAGGHGTMGGTKQQEHEQAADEMSFLLWQLRSLNFQPDR